MRRFLIRFLMLLIFVALAAGVWLYTDYHRFIRTSAVDDAAAQTFSIQSGDSVATVVRRLQGQGVLGQGSNGQALDNFQNKRYAAYIKFWAQQQGQAHQLKVGQYQLIAGMTPPELLDLFVSGKTIVYRVQFIEGWTFADALAAIRSHPKVEQTLTFVPAKDMPEILGSEISHYEGLLFPDTFQFAEQAKDIDILKQSHHLMKKNLETAWQARHPDIVLKTPYELLILASIIEKETALDSERHEISGVFHRRMAKGMRLQTDPTVIYGLGEQYTGRLTRSQLRLDTPYNTYTRHGLPPTPIALPGMASLIAAGQPDDGESLFFVADGKGGHTFSKTYEAHREAVKVYRQFQQSQ